MALRAALSRVRNLGVVAHIDAGKTTTTERMLFYAGMTRTLGDVDDGNTVTDFLQQEQERGITIKAAAITFGWRDHQINLIDTPGHVDFTIEVERTLRVLDGAVAVLDAASGVEAQTETVWRQADTRGVPRVVFVNKMDREGANWPHCLASLRERLGANPVALHLPLDAMDRPSGDAAASYTGDAVDLVACEVLRWKDRDGRILERTPLAVSGDARLREHRLKLLEAVAEHDDTLADLLLSTDRPAELAARDVRGTAMAVIFWDALRRVTVAGRAVPVLCGASFRNRGVQPLLDAVVDLLPSPLDRPPALAYGDDGTLVGFVPVGATPRTGGGRRRPDGDLGAPGEPVVLDDRPCALAFKVTHDRQRGPLVYFRVYSGTFEAKAVLFNATRGVRERPIRLLTVYAKQTEEVAEVTAGNIGVAVGLKQTASGDTFLGPTDKRRLRLDGFAIPPPVFTRSVEARTQAEEKDLQTALAAMLLEDPSLRLSVDADTGQTLLSGQGELHLEVVADRLRTEHGVEAHLGPMVVAYREAVLALDAAVGDGDAVRSVFDREVAGKRQFAAVSLRVAPTDLDAVEAARTGALGSGSSPSHGTEPTGRRASQRTEINGNTLVAAYDGAASSSSSAGAAGATGAVGGSHLAAADVLQALTDGVNSALARGPLLGYAIAGVEVTVSQVELTAESTLAAVAASAASAVRLALASAEARLLEPMMRVAVVVGTDHMGTVLSDLTRVRRGRVLGIDHLTSNSVRIDAEAPLAAMAGYASGLRSVTSGYGTFSMSFSRYGMVPVDDQTAILTAHGWRPPVGRGGPGA